MWEYKQTEIKYFTINDLNDQLNLLGSEYWEIIYYHELENKHIKVLLKRQKNYSK